MNAAAAMSAADITLRDGRYAALRNPSVDTAQAPRPATMRTSRARSHDEKKNMHAASNEAAAPKNRPVCAAR